MPLKTRPAQIPTEFTEVPPWVACRFEKADGRTTKVPRNAKKGAQAQSDGPATWATFSDALASHRRGARGVGNMLGATPRTLASTSAHAEIPSPIKISKPPAVCATRGIERRSIKRMNAVAPWDYTRGTGHVVPVLSSRTKENRNRNRVALKTSRDRCSLRSGSSEPWGRANGNRNSGSALLAVSPGNAAVLDPPVAAASGSNVNSSSKNR